MSATATRIPIADARRNAEGSGMPSKAAMRAAGIITAGLSPHIPIPSGAAETFAAIIDAEFAALVPLLRDCREALSVDPVDAPTYGLCLAIDTALADARTEPEDRK